MDFELKEEHKMIASTVRDFMETEIEPIAEQIDREDKLPDWIWKKLGDLGLMGMNVPEKYGGAGFDYLASIVAIEEMSKVCGALAMSYGVHINLCLDNIYRNANEEQREKYVPSLARGEKIGAMALTEPNYGSDATSIQLKAEKAGDYYILNGEKMFTSNGPIADTILLYARTDPDKGARGITAFIVEKGFEGSFTTRRLDKMGYRGAPTGQLFFEDYRVPKENVLGEENRGIRVMMSGLDTERTVMSAIPLGQAERALELSTRYAKERIQFGKPIAGYQLVQEKLANMYMNIEASRLLIYRAAELAMKSERGGKGTELHKLAAAAFLFSSEANTQIALDAVQIHGGYSYMLEYPVNRLFREAKLNEIGGGTTEMRRLIIAEELLGE
jgi:isovaleryl-CoA dehydrogenase